MTASTGACRGCGAPILWATMPSGRANPLNPEQVEPELGKGVVAFNPDTGRGMPVTYAVIGSCPAWAQQGVSFHTSHWASCSERERFKQPQRPPSLTEQSTP